MGSTGVPVLLSVNVGLPKNVPWQARPSAPACGSTRCPARRWSAGSTSTATGQGDTSGHGGEQQAVLVCQIQSYRHWREHFGRDDLGYGQFADLVVQHRPGDSPAPRGYARRVRYR